MIKLYLFRHGETDYNRERRVQCQVNIVLNDVGIKQAEKNSILLSGKGIQHIYSSFLKRARVTADILANKINVSVEDVEGLEEMHGGSLEGHFIDDIVSTLGEENYEKFSHTRNEGMEISYPSGETKREVRDRIFNTIKNICNITPYSIIGISSHGFVLREFIRSTDFEDDKSLDNCEVIEAEYNNDSFKINRRFKE